MIYTKDNTKVKLFLEHGFNCFTKNNKLFVISTYTKDGQDYKETEEATNWTTKETYHWLGY